MNQLKWWVIQVQKRGYPQSYCLTAGKARLAESCIIQLVQVEWDGYWAKMAISRDNSMYPLVI